MGLYETGHAYQTIYQVGTPVCSPYRRVTPTPLQLGRPTYRPALVRPRVAQPIIVRQPAYHCSGLSGAIIAGITGFGIGTLLSGLLSRK